MLSTVIITPTTGSPELNKCMLSVQEQDYKNIRHLIVIDGDENCHKAYDHFPVHHRDETIVLPTNVGGDGWYGHRVFASVPYLVDEDIVMFLDQDNWLEPNHVSSLVKTIESGFQWAYSLRTINDKEGNWICDDNCESLGKWISWPQTYFHIDTSCFAVPRDILVRGVCGAWYGKWGADRQFFNVLKQHFPNFGCSGYHSLNYRLAGNKGSVKPEFFAQGNTVMKENYLSGKDTDKFPWEAD